MVDRADNLRPFPLPAPELTPRARRASTVMPRRVRWLSRGRLAAGKITVLDGDPGLGKSSVALDWAARISTGRALPGEPGWMDDEPVNEPRGVVVLSAEDDDADTIVPRLKAAGADLRRIVFLDMLDEHGNEYVPLLRRHLWAIEQQIEATNAALIVIDPLMAYLDSEINANRDQDIRQVLSPFATMLARTECAALVLRHLNKATGMASLYRGGGSIGIIGAARVGLLAAKDDEDETGQRRILAVQKCNIGPEMPSLMYRIVSADGEAACVEWLGESSKTAGQLLGQPRDPTERDEATEAELWLRDRLADGPVDVVDIFREGQKLGFTQRMLRHAKAKLNATASRQGFGKDGVWRWYLPVTAQKTRPAERATNADPFADAPTT